MIPSGYELELSFAGTFYLQHQSVHAEKLKTSSTSGEGSLDPNTAR